MIENLIRNQVKYDIYIGCTIELHEKEMLYKLTAERNVSVQHIVHLALREYLERETKGK